MLKTLIAALLSFATGVAITKHQDDKKIIKLHRDASRAEDSTRSITYRQAWNDGFNYCKERFGIEE